MRVAFTTLGCKLNQYETDSLATQFQEAGYQIVDFAEPADAYVINSCTVTNKADRKSRNMLYRARRGGVTDQSLVVLTGCFVENHRDEVESDAHTMVVPNEQKQSIFSLVDGHFRSEVIHPAGSLFDFPSPSRIFHTRSMVKIQDGCDNFCTFCIIPQVRGRAVSRPADDVVADVTTLVEGGAKEVVLTGVNMGSYSCEGVKFLGLVDRCLEVSGDFRLRLSSLEPDKLSPRFVELFDHPKMCPHLHLCVQSASERVLLAMRRQYTFARFRQIAERLRARDGSFNITTDVIVGFPGETPVDLAQTVEAVSEIGFGHVHTFAYSRRSTTRADRMEGQIPEPIKADRSRQVRVAAEGQKRRYRESLIGSRQRMLIEQLQVDGARVVATGYGEYYVPLRLEVDTASATLLANSFVTVAATGIDDGDDPALTVKIAAEDAT